MQTDRIHLRREPVPGFGLGWGLGRMARASIAFFFLFLFLLVSFSFTSSYFCSCLLQAQNVGTRPHGATCRTQVEGLGRQFPKLEGWGMTAGGGCWAGAGWLIRPGHVVEGSRQKKQLMIPYLA